MNYTTTPLAALVILFSAILIFGFSTSENALRTAAGCIFLLVLLLLIVSVYKNSISIRIHAILLKQASSLVSSQLVLVLYVLFYLLLLVLFIGLVMFEFVGFWSNGRKIFLPA